MVRLQVGRHERAIDIQVLFQDIRDAPVRSYRRVGLLRINSLGLQHHARSKPSAVKQAFYGTQPSSLPFIAETWGCSFLKAENFCSELKSHCYQVILFQQDGLQVLDFAMERSLTMGFGISNFSTSFFEGMSGNLVSSNMITLPPASCNDCAIFDRRESGRRLRLQSRL